MTDIRRLGKANEFRCAAYFLLADWDVALPMVDTGADWMVSKRKQTYRVQCKARFSGQAFSEYAAWEGHPAPDLLYLDNGTDWWVVPWEDFLRAAGTPKRERYNRGYWDRYDVSQRRAQESFGDFLREGGVRRLEQE
jgi:hypothetical protein